MIKKDFSGLLTASRTFRVPFHDLDPAGVAWHGRYFKYFELARCALLESVNYSYAQMAESGYLWPVVDTRVRYVSPLVLDQKLTVIAALSEWELRMAVDYRIEDQDGKVTTRARTVQVPMDARTQELQFGCPAPLVENVENRLKELGLKGAG